MDSNCDTVLEKDPKEWFCCSALHSPSDVKTGALIGDQVPQELRVLLHTVLHVHLLLLHTKHSQHSES